MSKIGRWLEGMLGVVALIALAVLLTMLFSQARADAGAGWSIHLAGWDPDTSNR